MRYGRLACRRVFYPDHVEAGATQLFNDISARWAEFDDPEMVRADAWGKWVYR
jgi:hypothetical protein